MKIKHACGFVFHVEGTQEIWVTDMPTEHGKAIRFLGGENREAHLGVTDEAYSQKLVAQYQGIHLPNRAIASRKILDRRTYIDPYKIDIEQHSVITLMPKLIEDRQDVLVKLWLEDGKLRSNKHELISNAECKAIFIRMLEKIISGDFSCNQSVITKIYDPVPVAL